MASGPADVAASMSSVKPTASRAPGRAPCASNVGTSPSCPINSAKQSAVKPSASPGAGGMGREPVTTRWTSAPRASSARTIAGRLAMQAFISGVTLLTLPTVSTSSPRRRSPSQTASLLATWAAACSTVVLAASRTSCSKEGGRISMFVKRW